MKISQRIMILLIGVVGVAGCTRNPATGKRQLILISRDQEIAMGNQAAGEFEKEFGGKVPNSRLQAYVRSVGRKLAEVSDRPMPYEFTLVASKVPNAFALPGGRIFVTAGLMSRMENERELAAVLAHETAHVAAMHNVQALQRQVGAGLLIELAGWAAGQDKQKVAEAAAEIVTGMVGLKYSRKEEYQADEYGIRYMVRAGYNPYGMIELLTTLKNLSDTEGGTLSEMFRTHPLTQNRIDRAAGHISRDYKAYSPNRRDPHATVFKRHRRALIAEMEKTKGS